METLQKIDQYIEDNYARKVRKNVKRKFDESVFLPLEWKNGGEVPIKYVRFLIKDIPLYQCYNCKMSTYSRSLLELIEPKSGERFATKILDYIRDNGGFVTKNIFLFQIMACLGGKNIVDVIENEITRRHIANYTMLLRYNGSLDAARALLNIPKSIKSKGVIADVCKSQFNWIAINRRISVKKLREILVPHWDFDGLYFPFETSDGKQFKAAVNAEFKLDFIDENNEFYQNLPAKTSNDLKAKFENTQTEIKAFAKEQTIVLETAMCGQRRWTKETWANHFLKNPVLFVFAQQLIWAIFDKDGRLLDTFMIDANSSLENINHDKIELDSNHYISIMHPIQLSKKEKAAWDHSIKENGKSLAFDQLHRKVSKLKGNLIDLNFSRMSEKLSNLKSIFLAGVSCTFIEKKPLIHLIAEYEQFKVPIIQKIIATKAISIYKDIICPDLLNKAKQRGWEIEEEYLIKSFELLGVDVILEYSRDRENSNINTVGYLIFLKREREITQYQKTKIQKQSSRYFPLYKLSKIIFSEIQNDLEDFIAYRDIVKLAMESNVKKAFIQKNKSEKQNQKSLDQFKTNFEIVFYEGETVEEPQWIVELKKVEPTITSNLEIDITTNLTVHTEKDYKYCYFLIELAFELNLQKKVNDEMKHIYMKCVYSPLVINTLGGFDYEDYDNTISKRSHSLYPNMKILSNYMILKTISMIIEKGKEANITFNLSDLIPLFDKKIRQTILKQTVQIDGIEYFQM